MSPPARRVALSATAAALVVAASKIAVHLYAGRHYGYFVDELYYLACSRHLDWGFVDQPPFIALIAWIVRHTLGQSLSAIRILPALAGAAEVVLTAQLAGELGGGRFAQALAGTGILVAPGILVVDHFLSMNAFEPLIWAGCALLVVRMIKTGDRKLWIWFGILSGIGLENKYSMMIFGAGLVLGLAITVQRRLLFSPWLLVGGTIAAVLFLPNLLWNIQHHFPFLELQANIHRSGRDVSLGPIAFFAQETLTMQPLALPIWAGGLWWYFSRAGKPFRALGWSWVFTAMVILAVSPRIYYLFPAFPVLFAAGGVTWERWLSRPRLQWGKPVYAALLLIAGVVLSPMAIPVLSPEAYIHYTEILGIKQPRIEMHRLGPLPQLFADQFGWEEMTAVVAKVYNALPPEVRADTAIFGQNYGQAGAIDLFGPKYGLPPAISGHQSYFLWGPRNYTGASMIVMAGEPADLERRFASVQKVAHVTHPYSMPHEHFDVFYCRGLKQPLHNIWLQVKNWD
jgi:hypothetical protein